MSAKKHQNGNQKQGQALEGEVIPANPLPPFKRVRLGSVRDVRRELAKLYSEARGGRIDAVVAARLAYMLQMLAGLIRDSEFEARLHALEEKAFNAGDQS